MKIIDAVARYHLWLISAYTPAARPFAVLRIVFALWVLIVPRDVTWLSQVPAQFYFPPLGPFSLIPGPPSQTIVVVYMVVRAVVALWLIVGWKTLAASVAMSVVLLIGSGLAYSFSKVDHFILYDLTPIFLGFAGWGAAWSLDARRKQGRTRGYPMLLMAITIAIAMLTAALPKAARGWLDPAREATRYFVAVDVHYGPDAGVLADWMTSTITSNVLWKSLDYFTLFAEGWLIFALFVPTLFRLGLLLLVGFHVGVFLMMDISFFLNLFVYAAFFCLPKDNLIPELSWFRRRRLNRTSTTPAAAT
jgi:hypothetical protein